MDHQEKVADQLNRNIIELTRQARKTNSYRQTFARGVVGGVGTAVGATIIFGFLIALLGLLVDSVEDIPVLKSIVDSINLRQVINKN